MKKLVNLVLFSLFSIACLAGDGIIFVKNLKWEEIKAKAKKENKMIFFDGYATWCGPCKYMEKDIYTQKEPADYYNSHFINVKIDMESGEGPALAEEFGINSYPTLLFFSPEGKMVHKSIGALEADEFIQLGKDASDPDKQYFTLMEKAANLQLNDQQMQNWAAAAAGLEDEKLGEILTKYFSGKTNILTNKTVAETFLLYHPEITDAELKNLIANKKTLTTTLGWTADELETQVYSIMFRKAVKAYSNSESKDSFVAVIRSFDPASVEYAKKDLELRITLLGQEDNDRATVLLTQYLKDTKNPAGIKAIAGWILNFSRQYSEENFKLLLTTLSQYTLKPMDKDREYWLYLAQAICADQSGDTNKAKTAAAKAYSHKLLPEEFKTMLKEKYGL